MFLPTYFAFCPTSPLPGNFLPDQVAHLSCEIAEQFAERLVIHRAVFIYPLHMKHLQIAKSRVGDGRGAGTFGPERQRV